MGNVLISTSQVPSDFCFSTWQASWPTLVNLLTGQFNRSGTGINFGNSVPATVDEDKPWFRTNSDGTPDKWYVHASGLWLSKHTLPPGSIIMWEGAEANIETFDGGEAGAATLFTGQMWEKVTQLDARSPIGPGTLASGTVIALGAQTGAESVELVEANLPDHYHDIIANADGSYGSGDGGWILGTGSQATGTPARELPDASALRRTTRTEDAGETEPDEVNVIHPVYALWFLRRTSRLYYRV